MAIEFKKAYMLKVYTGEDIMLDDMPLYKAIVKKGMDLNLAGCTVSRGIAGYANTKRGMGRAVSSFISGLDNMPITIEFADSKENIEKILPFLEANATHALVTVFEINYLLTDFMRKHEKDLGKMTE